MSIRTFIYFLLKFSIHPDIRSTYSLGIRLNMIIVKTSIHNPAHLGSMFGLQQTFSSTARAIAPTFVSVLFAFNIERQILGESCGAHCIALFFPLNMTESHQLDGTQEDTSFG